MMCISFCGHISLKMGFTVTEQWQKQKLYTTRHKMLLYQQNGRSCVPFQMQPTRSFNTYFEGTVTPSLLTQQNKKCKLWYREFKLWSEN